MTDSERETVSGPWQDPSRPIEERVRRLLAEMTLEEKIAQLFGVWVRADGAGGDVAPHEHEMAEDIDLATLLPEGLGQLTRPFGSAPIEASMGAASLARMQERIQRAGRFGIPAMVHEECLAGFATWGATAYPVPLSWGAAFDPELIQQLGERIGRDLASVGVHQGLAPVLDVVRDYRWGRVEETIGEDPYLVGSVGAAYVRGLESEGIVATLKHFAGYSASRAGRNLAPVSMGVRERADVILLPFEMTVRESGVRSVMHAYTDTDGVPSASDRALLTGLLRETWGFRGTVVADYFGIAFLKSLHGVAGTWGEAAAAALTAGVDVELPTVKTFGAPLREEVRSGRLDEDVIEAAAVRVLRQKAELGLLDAGWSPWPGAARVGAGADGAGPAAAAGTDAGSAAGTHGGGAAVTADGATAVPGARAAGSIELDSADNRALARRVAEQAVVLVRNDGLLPLIAPRRIAVIGPNADDPLATLGCYSFPRHVGTQHPEVPAGIALPTLLESVRREFPDAEVVSALGCDVDGEDAGGIAPAVALAASADVTILVLGDRAGLFGRGTSGEGCDAGSLQLPGRQAELAAALREAGTPLVLALLSGRPYALGEAGEADAILQTFFPGEEGAPAIAGVLSGRVNPSGRLPVSIPARADAQPGTYLTATLGGPSAVSSVDPSAAYPFGHGLSYTRFDWSELSADQTAAPTDGSLRVSCTITNAGTRSGAEIVQLYLHDPVASVVRPVQRLIGFARIVLAAGASARVELEIPADLAAFTGQDGQRIVEPGELELRLAASSGDIRFEVPAELHGPVRVVDHTRRFHPVIGVSPVPRPGQLGEASVPAEASA